MTDLRVVPPVKGSDMVAYEKEPEPSLPPDPREMLVRSVVQKLHHFQSLVGQMQMQPTRDAKMNAILGNQALIMQALMLVLDDGLEPKEIRFQEQAAQPSPLVSPS